MTAAVVSFILANNSLCMCIYQLFTAVSESNLSSVSTDRQTVDQKE